MKQRPKVGPSSKFDVLQLEKFNGVKPEEEKMGRRISRVTSSNKITKYSVGKSRGEPDPSAAVRR
jgi:hypothetical protein